MKKNVVFALDVDERGKALSYVRKIAELQRSPDSAYESDIVKLAKSICAIKIGLLNVMESGLRIITDIRKITNIEIICDLKLADISYIDVEVAKKVAKAGADYIVVQGFIGYQPVKEIMAALPDMKIILVTEMTHNEGGFTHKYLEELAQMAKDLPIFGLLGPGNRPDRIKLLKKMVSDKKKIFAPGVTEWQTGDQDHAIEAGADFLIIGRSIMKIIDESIGSSIFEFNFDKIKQNLLLPAAFGGVAAILLFVLLPKLSISATTEKILVSASFFFVSLIAPSVIKRS